MPDDVPVFFVSYTGVDEEWAVRLVSWLERRGHRVMVQYADSPAGTNFLGFMDTAARTARWTIAVLSQDYLDSEFCGLEWQAAIGKERESGLLTLIPARVGRVEFGGSLLGQWGYIDLVGLEPTAAQARFVDAVEAVMKGAPLPSPPASRSHLIRSNVPLRNDDFVGRDEILGKLRGRYFDESGKPRPAARQILGGMSGTGKTEIAVEYAHRNADSYDVALFVEGGDKASAAWSYANLAEPLGLPGSPDIRKVRDSLDRVSRLLMIFDDVEEDYLDGLVPRRGHVLVTTRSPSWTDTTNIVEVGAFTRQESIELIVKRSGAGDRQDVDRQDVDKLAADLGDLPIAIDKLSRDAWKEGRSITRLRARMAESPSLVAGVGVIWTRTAVDLAADEPAAACLLRMMSLLAPDRNIPHALFEKNPAVMPEEMGAGAGADATWFDRALGPAMPSLWFRRTPRDHFAMHQVVATAVQHSMEAADRRRLRRFLVTLLHESALGGNAAIVQSPEVWTWWSTMLRHVLALVEHPETAEAIAGDDLPSVDHAELARKMADLRDRSATYLGLVGYAEEAVQLHRKALVILAGLDGPESASAARILRNLAGALLVGGAAATAVAAARRALAIDGGCEKPSDSVIATDHRMLARALLEAKDVNRAAWHAVRSLEVLTGRDFGGERVDVNDADAKDSVREIDAMTADVAAVGVPDFDRRELGLDAVSDTLGLLGTIARRKERGDVATTLLQAAVQLDERHREGRRPRPAEAERLFQLAELAEDRGAPADAAELNAQAEVLVGKAFGRDGPVHDQHPLWALPSTRAAGRSRYVRKPLRRVATVPCHPDPFWTPPWTE